MHVAKKHCISYWVGQAASGCVGRLVGGGVIRCTSERVDVIVMSYVGLCIGMAGM
jgi:hypothetical protein